MANAFSGKIEVDIRDSEPGWTPYLAPKAPDGAPEVLFIAWDDLGYATMDIFGGQVQYPNMARIADRGMQEPSQPALGDGCRRQISPAWESLPLANASVAF